MEVQSILKAIRFERWKKLKKWNTEVAINIYIYIHICSKYINNISKLDYGLSIWGCTTEGNLDRVPRIQNFCAGIIWKKYDYINKRGIDLGESLGIQTTLRPFSKCFNVYMYTWFGTLLRMQWCYHDRRCTWLQYQKLRKYEFVCTKV